MENNATNNWPKFSFFKKPIGNPYPYRDITMLDTYCYIIGDYAKAATEKLRTIPNEADRKAFKKNNFDYITPSGTFSYHNDASLIKHSQYMVIDLDHLENLETTHQQLINDEYFEPQLLFTSPYGDGLKWFIEIDLSLATHNEYFDAIVNYLKRTYNIVVDETGRNVSRGCFLPHDPDCYINPKYLNYE